MPNLSVFKEAFPHTIPMLLGFILMGATFGVLVQQEGYGFWVAVYGAFCLCRSGAVFGGWIAQRTREPVEYLPASRSAQRAPNLLCDLHARTL